MEPFRGGTSTRDFCSGCSALDSSSASFSGSSSGFSSGFSSGLHLSQTDWNTGSLHDGALTYRLMSLAFSQLLMRCGNPGWWAAPRRLRRPDPGLVWISPSAMRHPRFKLVVVFYLNGSELGVVHVVGIRAFGQLIFGDRDGRSTLLTVHFTLLLREKAVLACGVR